MKLKTLKDLMVYASGWTFSGKRSKKFPYPMVREVDIKAEAIKWVKEIKKDPFGDLLTGKKALIRFFNITEEDLQ